MTSPNRGKLSNRQRQIMKRYEEQYPAQCDADPLAPEELLRLAKEQLPQGERLSSSMIRHCKSCGTQETLTRPFIEGECDACIRAKTPRNDPQLEKCGPLTLFGWEVGVEKVRSDVRGLRTSLGRTLSFLCFPTPRERNSPEFVFSWCLLVVLGLAGFAFAIYAIGPMPTSVPSSGSSNYEPSSRYEQGYQAHRERDRQEAYGALRDHGWSESDSERGAATIEEMHTRDRQIRSGSYQKP